VAARRIDSAYVNNNPAADPTEELTKMLLFAANPATVGRKLGGRMPSARMSTATDDILAKLKDISLLEASELVKQIEETFGVDASAPAGGGMMMAAPAAGGAGAGDDDAPKAQTEFDLILDSVNDKKIPVLKVIRTITGMGLQDAKKFVDAAPKTVLEGKTKGECEDALKQIVDAGGAASIK